MDFLIDALSITGLIASIFAAVYSFWLVRRKLKAEKRLIQELMKDTEYVVALKEATTVNTKSRDTGPNDITLSTSLNNKESRLVEILERKIPVIIKDPKIYYVTESISQPSIKGRKNYFKKLIHESEKELVSSASR